VTKSRNDLRKALLVIVTYNSYEDLPKIIGSIRDFEGDHPGNHVVVVENSSDLRVRDYIESGQKADRIRVEVAARNEGFSHGVNLGYRLAQDLWGDFDFVVLLNPDVESAARIVCELVNRAEKPSETSIGVWGAVLRGTGGDVDRGCARRLWNRRRFFSHLVGYPNLVSVMRTEPRSLTEYEIENDQRELAMVSGALMCIRVDVLEDGLDTLLPMYLEDQEICMRSLSRGCAVRLYPDLEAMHVGGVSRKSVADHDHALRIMELVESPVHCMRRLQGYTPLSLRMVVLLGGISRLMAAPLAAAFKALLRKATFREEMIWMQDQQRLAMWFVCWSIKGTLHCRDVSLADYFQEYASQRRNDARR
jgi:N-acetylglucosaminyl-diphospho-decaprenol L-rhamnosyltransferase